MPGLEPKPGYTYSSGKNYCHNVGLSACFRQWRAIDSHCHFLHGYALQVELEFENLDDGLDERNWVQDFGGLKPIKAWLEDHFDHKTLVAKDDPLISTFREMHNAGMIDLVLVEATGCEAFARMIFEAVSHMPSVRAILTKVTVREHGGNWARYGQR